MTGVGRSETCRQHKGQGRQLKAKGRRQKAEGKGHTAHGKSQQAKCRCIRPWQRAPQNRWRQQVKSCFAFFMEQVLFQSSDGSDSLKAAGSGEGGGAHRAEIYKAKGRRHKVESTTQKAEGSAGGQRAACLPHKVFATFREVARVERLSTLNQLECALPALHTITLI